MSITTPISSTVVASATSVLLAAANVSRKSIEFHNVSSADLVVKTGGTASFSDYTWLVPALAVRRIETQYPGAIHGIWASASGAVRITQEV